MAVDFEIIDNNELQFDLGGRTELEFGTRDIIEVRQSEDYEDLTNKPSINGVTLIGNKTTEDLGIEAGVTSWNGQTGDVVYTPPEAPVQSVNGKVGAVVLGASDVGALPSNTPIPSKTSDLQNDSGYITGIDSTDVTSALGFTPYNATNPSGYVNATQAANAAPVQSVNGQTGEVVLTIPTKTSELQNDSGYLTAETDPTVPSWAKEANPPSYELTYDESVSVGSAVVGEAVTGEPNYTPSGDATLDYEVKDGKLYIYGITFKGSGVKFAVEQEQ